MLHDIIDNRDALLVDHIGRILPTARAAKFAVGYFFLSGFGAVREHLDGLESIRLLIGNTSDRETIEQISEGCRRLDLARGVEERERYRTRSERRARSDATAENVRRTLELMDQTDKEEALVRKLVEWIASGRMEVRVHTQGRLHAKAYIFDYPADGRYEKGLAIVGSSNLSLAGLSHNTELNVVVHGEENHAQLTRWFDALWAESHEFDQTLMQELQASWAGTPVRPYDVYMKALFALVADRLDEGEKDEILWDDEITRSLADFQKVAVRQAVQMIRDSGGAFVSDVVGLGKSYIGAGIVKHFQRIEGARPLILCPKPLEEMWNDYNETFDLNAVVLPISLLQSSGSDGGGVLESKRFRDRDFVLIDESHNFRHHTSLRYEVLQNYLMKGRRKVLLITATPRNKSAADVYNQIKLFHHEDITYLPIDPPNLKEYFKQVASGEKRLQDLLVHILVRRTRRHILRWYGYAEDTRTPLRELSDGQARKYLDGRARAYVMVSGRHQFFPRRELETLRYSIEDTYSGLYDELRGYLGRAGGKRYTPAPGRELTYARYGLWHYVRKPKQNREPYQSLHRSGVNLRGLIRVMLFKRFESSVHAFRESLRRLERIHGVFLDALDEGIVPAGEDSQQLLYESDCYEETDLLDQLRACSGRYKAEDFDVERLREHIEADRSLLGRMLELIEPITPEHDDKLRVLVSGISERMTKASGKVLIFTQFADTARYLYENLNPGGENPEVEVIYGTEKSKARVAARFAPLANPHIRLRESDPEIRVLVATDVMSEGLNLQDGDVAVNYDLHWNPVRLIQRFGRIDRIGSENEVIWGFNFLPEKRLDTNLGLTAILRARIAEIHETIGEDAAILDKDEELNEEAMFAIYEKDGGKQTTLFDESSDDFIDLNEAEEILRTLREENPAEFERIANLRDGIRSSRAVVADPGLFVFCQAGRFQQLFLLDVEGRVVSRDVPAVIGRLRCAKDEPPTMIPREHNAMVMQAKAIFEQEVRHRKSQQQYGLNLTLQQRYVLRELRALFAATEDPDVKSRINVLEPAFKRVLTPAVKRQLNFLRRNGVTGQRLLQSLAEIYQEHGLRDADQTRSTASDSRDSEVPRIICSEALV